MKLTPEIMQELRNIWPWTVMPGQLYDAESPLPSDVPALSHDQWVGEAKVSPGSGLRASRPKEHLIYRRAENGEVVGYTPPNTGCAKRRRRVLPAVVWTSRAAAWPFMPQAGASTIPVRCPDRRPLAGQSGIWLFSAAGLPTMEGWQGRTGDIGLHVSCTC